MRAILCLGAILLVACCAAAPYGAVSSQYAHIGHDHSYSYGYADPNSQKHESRSHDGVTRGSYSYVDGHGHVQSVSYTADPHHGFNAVGTNLPKAPAAIGPHYAAAAHAYVPYAAHSHHGPQAHIALTHAGVPVDTPEVQHARAAHLAAHAAAAHDGHHHLYKRSLYAAHAWSHAPALHGGLPVDTPEVQHAKAAHFAAHAAARSGHGGLPAAAHHGAHHIPIIHNGVPVDTPEVQHAKAAHYAAVAEASSRAGHGGGHHDDGGHYDDGHYDGRWDGGHQAGWDHGAGHAGATSYATHSTHSAGHGGAHYDGGHHYDAGYKGPIHIPVIHNGVPVEPAEVQHARAAHLSAVAAAGHGGGYHHY